MSRRMRCVKLVLPTEHLLRRFEMHQPLLDKADATWHDVAEYAVGRWAHYVGQTGRYMGEATALSPFEFVYGDVRLDFIDANTLTIEPDDADALRTVLRAFLRKFFDSIICLIEQFHLSEYQLQTLRVDTWLANSMVLCVYS